MINQPDQINLDRLSDTTFVLDTLQEDTLYLIANSGNNHAAPAKALLTILTDTIFPPEVPDELEERYTPELLGQQRPAASQQLLLLPNPANGTVKVVLPTDMPEATVQVFDMAGKLRKTFPVTGGEHTLSISDLRESIYFLKAGNGDRAYHAKLLIQR